MTTDKTPATLAFDVRSVWAEMADSIATRRDTCLERGQFMQAEFYQEMLAKHSLATIAVDELIEADSEYDRARAAWLADHSKHNEFLAAREAWNRRAAALARVKGESA